MDFLELDSIGILFVGLLGKILTMIQQRLSGLAKIFIKKELLEKCSY